MRSSLLLLCSAVWCAVVFVLSSSDVVHADESETTSRDVPKPVPVITGKIVSCSKQLQKHHELRSFLQDGEAEYYQGVTLRYVEGRRDTILTVYHDTEQYTTINLYELKTKDQMHQIMIDHGFVKRSQEEIKIQRDLLQSSSEEESDEEARQRRMIEERKQQREERRKANRDKLYKFDSLNRRRDGIVQQQGEERKDAGSSGEEKNNIKNDIKQVNHMIHETREAAKEAHTMASIEAEL